MLGAGDDFAVGVSGDFDGNFAGGNFRQGLADEPGGLEKLVAAHGAAGIGIALGAGDGVDKQVLERGVTEGAHVLRHAAGAEGRADAAEVVGFLSREHADIAKPRLHGTVVDKHLGDPGDIRLDFVQVGIKMV